MAPGQNQAQPHWWEGNRSFTTTPYLPGQVVKQHRTVIVYYSLPIHNTVLSLISPLTRSVILLVCPRNILTIRLISISTTCISKSSKETASKELCKKKNKKKTRLSWFKAMLLYFLRSQSADFNVHTFPLVKDHGKTTFNFKPFHFWPTFSSIIAASYRQLLGLVFVKIHDFHSPTKTHQEYSEITPGWRKANT